jgi:hypothetical protein
VLQTSTNVLIATYDNIVGINSNFVNFTAEQEIQTATAGQTVFNLTTMQYQPGTNSLTVYVDGVNQYGPGAQFAYTETDSDTVTFVSGLHVGASVKFTTATQTTGNATDASVVSYTPLFTGGVTTNVEAKLAQTVSVMDFGAAGDGVTDDTAAIQAAITAVTVPLVTTLFPNGTGTVVFPNGKYKITGNIDVTCNLQNEGGKLEVYSGGRLTFATSYVVASAIEIEVMEDFSAQIVQVSHAHITLVDFKIYSQTGDEPLHTAINVAPPLANGLFDVKIVRPYIRSCLIGIKLETAIGSGEGWITDVIISEASIIAFRLFGVRFNDAGGKGINYCSVDKLMLENIAVNSLLKYGVSCTGILFGNSFTDLKDFNDDPLLGTYFTIFCEDNDLNALAAVQGSPTLANHIMQFTRNVFSNCRVEGNISLGLLRNLYTLTDIHVYNKIGILPLMGYDYYHDYGPDMISKEIDLATATLEIANPADATFVAESNRLKVFMNANSIAQVRLDLPPWFIAAANATGYCTIGFATDFVTELGAGVNFAIRSGSPLVPIDSTSPSTNMRSDERLVVLTYNLSGITLVTGDKIVIDFTGVSGEVYSVNSIYAYAQLANPVLNLTPFINTVY